MGKFSPHIFSILHRLILIPSVPLGLGWREKPKTVLGINFGAPHDTAGEVRVNQYKIKNKKKKAQRKAGYSISLV
jgi:hypothetical protein